MSNNNYRTVLKLINSIQASVDALTAAVTPDHPLFEKIIKLKGCIEDKEDITSDGTVLAIRKLLESCRSHPQFKPAFKLCSDFCHDQSVPREPTLIEIQILIAYLTIMIVETKVQSKEEVEPVGNGTEAIIDTKRSDLSVKDTAWPVLPPKRSEEPKLEPNQAPTNSNISNIIKDFQINNTSKNNNPNAPNNPPAPATQVPKVIRQIKNPGVRCKHYQANKTCPRGIKCNFAHEDYEYQPHPNFKKDICREWRGGVCPYQECPEKCAFAHGYDDMAFD